MNYEDYLKQKTISIFSEQNTLRKQFLDRLNRIIYVVGTYLNKNETILIKDVEKIVSITFFLSPSAVKRYSYAISNSGIFDYDEENQTLCFPPNIITKIRKEPTSVQ